MQRLPLRVAVAAAAAAVGLATVINVVLTLLAGDTLRVAGELGVSQVLVFTLVMVIPTAVVLWLLPRWLSPVAFAVAVLTLPFPFLEFGTPIGWWLGAMHLVTATCAALVAPRIVGRTT